MMLCLVTDRRRLGTALGASASEWTALVRRQVRAASQGGIDLVQLREPDLDDRRLVALARSLVADTAGTGTRIVVNDRFDVAMAAGAHGVHLKDRSLPPSLVRARVPRDFLIGVSIHGRAGMASKAGADYVIAGAVLPTISKPGAAGIGWDELAAIVRAGTIPVMAIGGLDAHSIPKLAASGAAGLAAIGAFVPTAHQELESFVKKRAIDLRFLFDSASKLS